MSSTVGRQATIAGAALMSLSDQQHVSQVSCSHSVKAIPGRRKRVRSDCDSWYPLTVNFMGLRSSMHGVGRIGSLGQAIFDYPEKQPNSRTKLCAGTLPNETNAPHIWRMRRSMRK